MKNFTFKKNEYFNLALLLYLNYMIHGMSAVILTLNLDFLMQKFSTDMLGISFIVSGFGIGRLPILYLAGVFSDKYGRKPSIILALCGYIIFFIGILITSNLTIAFILALICGASNGILDTGTYPALMEIFPNASGSANILIKAFMSLGQFMLPFIITFIIKNNLYFGYSFILCAIVMTLDLIIILKLAFPPNTSNSKSTTENKTKFSSKPNFFIEGICLILIGFTCTTTFYTMQMWLPTYGESVLNIEKTLALKYISFYSIGSILSIFISSFIIIRFLKPVKIIFIYPLISLVTLIVLWKFPSNLICMVCSFVIGFTAAGGVLQLVLTTMSELFPNGKGKTTGLVSTSSAIAISLIPVITSKLSTYNVKNIVLFNILVTFIGVILAIIVNMRYKKLTLNKK